MTSITAIAKHTFKEALRDNLTGEAAKVAYYFFLSLFPLVLVAFALTGLIGGIPRSVGSWATSRRPCRRIPHRISLGSSTR
jgi:uncharacterized BrkB/YihY/UPF0761 family membrane protein